MHACMENTTQSENSSTFQGALGMFPISKGFLQVHLTARFRVNGLLRSSRSITSPVSVRCELTEAET